MSERALHFLDIPTRSEKPRGKGLTLARDYGISFREAEDWMESAGAFIDYVKMRHLFSLLMGENEDDVTRRKIQLYREHDVDVNPGGIVFEIAFVQNQVPRTFETLARRNAGPAWLQRRRMLREHRPHGHRGQTRRHPQSQAERPQGDVRGR